MADTWKDQRDRNNNGKGKRSNGHRTTRRDPEQRDWKTERRLQQRANRRNGISNDE